MKTLMLNGLACTLLATICQPVVAEEGPRVISHVPVYDVDGRFGGWPANHGIWAWGDEILVGFSAGHYKYQGPTRHGIDRERPEYHLLARSQDGGRHWKIFNPSEKGGVLLGTAEMRHGTVPPGYKEAEPVACPGGIDFTHPDFAMTVRMSGVHTGQSRFYYSYDRGESWKGPFKLPALGQRGIAARTDYVINGKRDCTLFLTASKSNDREGRPFCVRTQDGGKTWKFLSYIGPEPNGFSIMPSTVRLDEKTLLTTVRRREGKKRFIAAYRSNDDGKSWTYLNTPVPEAGIGNPPCLIQLRDGRLCLTYGYRAEPYGVHARLSSDQGKTWSPEPIILRNDGGGRDVGYARTVERPDGKIVTVYYFQPKDDVDRAVIATIWDPGR